MTGGDGVGGDKSLIYKEFETPARGLFSMDVQ